MKDSVSTTAVQIYLLHTNAYCLISGHPHCVLAQPGMGALRRALVHLGGAASYGAGEVRSLLLCQANLLLPHKGMGRLRRHESPESGGYLGFYSRRCGRIQCGNGVSQRSELGISVQDAAVLEVLLVD